MCRLLLLLACLLPLVWAIEGPTVYQPFGPNGLISGAGFLQEMNEGFFYVTGSNSSGFGLSMVNASTLQTVLHTSFPVPGVKETFMWPFEADSQILVAAVTSSATVFLLYDSVLNLQCNNTFQAPLKAAPNGQQMGLIAGGVFWFLDPSSVATTRNRFWSLQLSYCNLTNSSTPLPLTDPSFSFSFGFADPDNNGLVCAVGYNTSFNPPRPAVALLEFSALPDAVFTTPEETFPLPPRGLTQLQPFIYAMATPTNVFYIFNVMYAGWQGGRSAQLPTLPTNQTIAISAADYAYTFLGSTTGYIWQLSSESLSVVSSAPISRAYFSAWQSLVASGRYLLAQTAPGTLLRYLV